MGQLGWSITQSNTWVIIFFYYILFTITSVKFLVFAMNIDRAFFYLLAYIFTYQVFKFHRALSLYQVIVLLST